MARHASARRAMTLLELLAGVAILAMLVLLGVPRFGHDTLANVAAHGFGRRLGLDLSQTRRRTIATGDNHYVLFTVVAGEATGYAVWRRTAGGDQQVDSLRDVPTGVTVTPSATVCEFTFDGTALGGYTITVAGPDRQWLAAVVAGTGCVTVTEI